MNGTLIKSVDLFYQEGSSDKVYFLQIEKSNQTSYTSKGRMDLYVVNFSYGKIGRVHV